MLNVSRAWQSTSKTNLLGFRKTASTRSFHSTRRLHNDVLGTCCTQSFEIMNALHGTTGLSWVYILPITALAIRTTLVVPISIWSRNNLKKMREIQPLLLTWMAKLQLEIPSKHRGLGQSTRERIIKQEHKKKTLEIRKDFGITVWSAYAPLIQVPFFLITIETIRQMCTETTGFLAWISTKVSGELYESTIPLQQSLAVEGALWFPNLLQPDPYYILPVALSTMLYSSIAYNERLRNVLRTNRTERGSLLTQALKIVSIAMLLVTYQLPAGMLVYWVSSSTFALMTTFVLEHRIPIARGMIPCRPLLKPWMQTGTSNTANQPTSFLKKWTSDNL